VRRIRASAPALIALGLGAGLAFAAQLVTPTRAPLYDGVPQVEPYRYLLPGPNQAGEPGAFASAPGLESGQSRTFVAATTEQPPQAQLIALGGAMSPPSGATTMNVSIEPVEPGQLPSTGAIAGNVYHFAVVDDAGNEYTIAPGAQPTLTLRAPEGVADAVIGHLTVDGWVALTTEHGGAVGLYQVIPTELGDYAILTGVAAPSSLGTLLAAGLTIGVPLLLAIAYFVRRGLRDRRRTAEAAEAAKARARIPSKRRRRR
jgi:hypothetical protein